MRSSPSSPKARSSPAPTASSSSPVPPTTQSSPAKPITRSLPAPAKMLSAPSVPRRLSRPPVPSMRGSVAGTRRRTARRQEALRAPAMPAAPRRASQLAPPVGLDRSTAPRRSRYAPGPRASETGGGSWRRARPSRSHPPRWQNRLHGEHRSRPRPRVSAVLRTEDRVTPLELFFDLVFVLAITQCTALMAADPSWRSSRAGC